MCRPRSSSRLVRMSVVVVGLVFAVGTAQLGAGAGAGEGFDGDGRGDLVIGVYGEEVNGQPYAGAVNVIYGSDVGLTGTGNQLWHQDSPGILDQAEESDKFGVSVAIGDFNGDRLADAAVGIGGEDVGGAVAAGAVQVLYGAAGGLSSNQNQFWSQDSPLMLDPAENNDFFGSAVAAGDFDGDGYDDLAVGVRGEDLGTKWNAGAVNVLYGTANGLTSVGNMIIHQDLAGTDNGAEIDDYFGSVLATGDFDGDGFDDLAVGMSQEDNGSVVDSGAVHVFYGSAAGLDPADDWFFHQNTDGIADITEDDDLFGSALAAGDFDGDGFDDLAVGVQWESIGAATRCGLVHAIYGSAAGLSATGSQFWHQSIAGSADAAEDQDQFGSSLAAANFDGDGFDDLAVGVPGESSEGVFTVGAVHVLYGAAGGLSIARNWWFNQNTPGMLDEAEQLDSFGNPVVAGAFNRDGYADLAIGIVREGIGTVVDCGAVSVVHGSRLGLTTIGNQLWHQGSPGILGDNDSGQFFGTAIAATPPAWLFVDDFETGDLGRWSGAVP